MDAQRLLHAVRTDDVGQVRAMLSSRPELARCWVDNLQPLHYAVFHRSAEMVRLLMQNGADARGGVYPYEEATSPLTIAAERGYEDIAAVIREEEQRRCGEGSAAPPQEITEAIQAGDDEGAIRRMETDPGLIQRVDLRGMTPLHVAAWMLRELLVTWLLENGADANARGRHGWTPLDAAASRFARGGEEYPEHFRLIAARLMAGGAEMTARAAVALGDADWIRSAGQLPGPIDSYGGLLRIAVTHDRPDILRLLLDKGLDVDERVRVPGVDNEEYTWGFPLWECAATGRHRMAELLLERGADPNAMVYASGTPVHQAYGQRDAQMIALLARHGGVADAGLAALHRLTDLARRAFDETEEKQKAAAELLGQAACGGDVEIVRLVLPFIAMSRDDRRWFGFMEAPLRLWNHGPGHWCHHEWDRGSYLECFRLIVSRCDVNLRGRGPDKGQSAFTILHMVTAGRVPWMTEDEQVAFAEVLLDMGARLDVRDHLLRSTPLGWACRWGRVKLAKLFLAHGADPVEADAEPWAAPLAWAEKKGRHSLVELLRSHGQS
ncbi:MAG: ankyrin repeat domain-containing protein [Bryobacteraceae bacterium]